MAVTTGGKRKSKSGGTFTKGPSKKSTKLGGGGRFENCVASGKSEALCASIGRKSLGKGRFQKLAAKGRKRAAKKRKK